MRSSNGAVCHIDEFNDSLLLSASISFDGYGIYPFFKGFKFWLDNSVYVENRTVVTPSKKARISISATKVLFELKRKQNKIVTREELLICGWGCSSKVLNNVNVVISEIRTALTDTSIEIITHRGIGFSFCSMEKFEERMNGSY